MTDVGAVNTQSNEIKGFEYDAIAIQENKSKLLQTTRNSWFRYLYVLSEVDRSENNGNSGPSWTLLFLVIAVLWLQVASAALAKGFNWADTYIGWLGTFAGLFSASEWYFGIGEAYIGVSIIVIVLLIFQIGCVVLLMKTIETKDLSVKHQWLLAALRVMNTSFSGLLFFPFMLILVSTIQCDRLDIDTCWSGIHIILGCLSLFMAMWLLISSIISVMTVFPSDKYGNASTCRVHTYCDIIFLLFKVFLIIIWVAVDEEDMPWILSIYLLFGTLLLLYAYILYLPFTYLKANFFYCSLMSLWVWLSICLIITNLEDDDSLASGALVFYLASPFVVLVTVQSVHLRVSRIDRMPIQKCTSAYQVELKLRFSKLMYQYEVSVGLVKKSSSALAQVDNGNVDKELSKLSKRELHSEVENFLYESSKKLSSSCFLHIIWARFYLGSYKQNIHKALKYLKVANKCFPRFDQRFAIYREQERIRLNNLSEPNNKEVINFLEFEKSSRNAIEQEKIIARGSVEFWTEVGKSSPNFEKLHVSVGTIREAMTSAKTSYSNSLRIRPNSIFVLGNYGRFLDDIMGETAASHKMLQKMHSLKATKQKESKLLATENYRENSNLFQEENLIVALGTEEGHIGEILDCNDASLQMLGYGRQELIGKNISSLMPYPFSDMHDGFLSDFLDNGFGKLINTRRTVLALDKAGYAIAIDLQIEEVISAQMQPIFIGAIRTLNSGSVEYALVNNLGFVTYTSKGVGNLFSMGSGSNNGNAHVPITDWFPLWDSQTDEFDRGKAIEDHSTLSGEKVDLNVKAVKIKIREHVLSVLTISISSKSSMTFMEKFSDAGGISDSEDFIDTKRDRDEDVTKKSGNFGSGSSYKKVGFEGNELEQRLMSSIDNLAIRDDYDDDMMGRDLLTSNVANFDQFNSATDKVSMSSAGKSKTFSVLRDKVNSGRNANSISLRNFRWTLILTVLLMILLALVSGLLLLDSLKSYEKDLDNTQYIGVVEFLVATSVYIVDFMRIEDAGTTLADNIYGSMTEWKTDLNSVADRMETLVNSLRDNKGKLGSESPSPFALIYVDITEFGDRVVSTDLEDALLMITANARAIAQSDATVKVDKSNVNSDYILVNGMTTILSGVKEAQAKYEKKVEDDYTAVEFQALILLLVSLGVVIAILSTLIIPVLIKTEKNKCKVFEVFLNIPRKIRSSLLQQAEYRLAEIEGHDVSNLNDFEDNELVINKNEHADVLKISDLKKKKIDEQKQKHKTSSFKFNMLIRISVLFFLCILYFVIQYIVFFVADVDLKEHSSVLLSISNNRRTAIRSAVYYANQYSYQLSTDLNSYSSSYEDMKMFQRNLLYGNSSRSLTASLGMNGEQQSIIYDDACVAKSVIPENDAVPWPLSQYTVSSCETVFDTKFTSGLFSAINSVYNEFQSLEVLMNGSSGSDGKSNYESIEREQTYQDIVKNENIYFQQSIAASADIYYQETHDKIVEDKFLILILMIVFIVLSVLVLLFNYIPLMRKVQLEICRTQQMIFLIPAELLYELESIDSFKELFSSIFAEDMKA